MRHRQLRLRPLALGALAALLAALAALSAVVVGAGSASASDSTQQLGDGLGREALVGSWRLVSFEARLSGGQVIYPFGHDAGGTLTYTRDGRMSVAVWKANRQPYAINDQQRGTAEEYTASVQSYISYFGTFSVDRAAGTVSHQVEQSIFPNWNGGTQTRFFELTNSGDSLELTTPPVQFGGQTLVGALVWERLDRDAL